MSTIIDQLNRRLKSDLHEINHESLNSTFVGYSNLYRQSIFVKQFAKEQGYYTEKMVTNQLNDRVLGGFSLNNTFILVLKDCSPKDIGEKIDSNLAFEMGQVLGEYHLKVKPFIRIKLVNGQFDDYVAEIDSFKESFRETPKKVAQFRQLGADTVEMECAALAACAQFRKVDFAQLLFTGDSLAQMENYNRRGWGRKSYGIGLEIGSKVLSKLSPK